MVARFFRRNLLTIISLVIAAGAVVFIFNETEGKPQEQVAGTNTGSMVTVKFITVEAENTEYHVAYADPVSAYDLLTELDEKHNDLQLGFDEFDFGHFLTDVNGYAADPQTEFWAFKINGADSNAGVSDYIVQPDDTLIFELESFNL